MEKKVGDFLTWVVGVYGRSLDWFLNASWLAAVIYAVCILGIYLFWKTLPFSLLPAGDSGFARGVFIAQEGSSPDQMRAYQEKVNQVLQKNPAVGQYLTLAGLSGRAASSQAILPIFLKDAKQRPPIETIIAQLTAEMGKIPGIVARIQPSPVLQINIGATNQNSGRYAYTLSGINPEEVYAAGARLTAKMLQFPGFASVQSDYFNHTPNLDINIARDRASLYGVSTARIESLLRSAYSENYAYLIKQSDDQYQVILETNDASRDHPEDLNQLYIKADNNQTLVPLRAITDTKESVGLQAVNHYNQFTSVTINYNLKPGVADSGDLEVDVTALLVTLGEAARERATAVALIVDELQYLTG